MKVLMSCYFLVLGITRTFSVSVSTPGIQRKIVGESCMFQWNVIGDLTTYTIQNPPDVGSSINHTFNRWKNVIKLWIWNIERSNAGVYYLSINSGTSTEVNSAAFLFIYAYPSVSATVAVGRNPAFEGDAIELSCTAASNSTPAANKPKMYYHWSNGWYGSLRNISSGPAVLQNGDALPGYSFKNDGKSLVIASVQYPDSNFYCYCQEEGSPYRSYNYSSYLEVFSKPYAHYFYPASRIFNAAPFSSVWLYFAFNANPPLTSCTNWSFKNASGATTELPVTIYSTYSGGVYLSFSLASSNSYGNYSVTLTNSNGSRTETFQVLPPGPPDVPSNFGLQYVTHRLVSLKWRCKWFNGLQQTVIIRLMDVTHDAEVGTQGVTVETYCYNSYYSTLFQEDIQPETDYEANIWSINTFGSSNVVKLTVRTPKRLIFSTSSANISILGTQARIKFRIMDSTKVTMWLNVTCCDELTTQCSNKTYTISNTDNQIVYDILPTGDEYVFDFNVYDTDGYTYMYSMAFVRGVRVSRMQGPPDVPSNFTVLYVTHSLVSLQWRCMWFNGFQQTVFVRLMDVANDTDVETQSVTLPTNCNNSAYTTLFQINIQPETNYEASIWSVNTLGSSNVVKLAVRTNKTSDPTTNKPNQDSSLIVAVIVLAVLLGFAILGLIGGLIAFLLNKSRQKLQPNVIRQPSPTGRIQPSNTRGLDNTSNDYEKDCNYEELPKPSYDNSSYTPLELLPPQVNHI